MADPPHGVVAPQLQPGVDDAALITYTELHQAGIALRPPLKTHDASLLSPILIHRASSTPQRMKVIPFGTQRIYQQDTAPVFLVRQNGARQAYALTDPHQTRPDRVIGWHRHDDWGCVYFGIVYPGVPGRPREFQAPDPRHVRRVAIKRLRKQSVREYWSRTANDDANDLFGMEDPIKEMNRMQEIGDNIHVLKEEEFLDDDLYWYIVTPHGTPLKDIIPFLRTDTFIDRERCHAFFCKMLRILLYLLRKGIVHHDISPDNFLILPGDNLVIFDLALSFQLPTNPASTDDQKQRALIAPHPPFGTNAWMDPVAYHQLQYDGVAFDLWATVVILYNLLTNQILYRIPCHSDLSFRFCILTRGLSSEPRNEQAIEVFNMRENDGSLVGPMPNLQPQAIAHLNLSPESIELFEHTLRVSPTERYTLAEVVQSAYVQNAQH